MIIVVQPKIPYFNNMLFSLENKYYKTMSNFLSAKISQS